MTTDLGMVCAALITIGVILGGCWHAIHHKGHQ